MPYRHGTLDALQVMRSKQRKDRRRIAEANSPSGSQPNQTSLKVNSFNGDFSGIKTTAETALSIANQAQSGVVRAQTTAEAAQTTANDNTTAIGGLSSEIGSIGSMLSLSTVLADSVEGLDLTVGDDAVSVQFPMSEDYTRLMLVIGVYGMMQGGPSPLSLKVSVTGLDDITIPCAYAGDMSVVPGKLTGAHEVNACIPLMLEQSGPVTVSAGLIAVNADDYPASESNRVTLSVRADWRKQE